MEGLGKNLLIVLPQKAERKENLEATGSSEGLVYEDALAIQQESSLAKNIAPSISMAAKIKYLDNNINTSVEGTVPDYQEVRNFYAEKGVFFSEEDVLKSRRVAVLGKRAQEKLFPNKNPIGETIKIQNVRFLVIGVMEEKGQVVFINFDDLVFIPITTAMRRLKGSNRLNNIQIETINRDLMQQAVEETENILLRRHNQVIDFRVTNQEDYLNTVEKVTQTFKLLLGGIAAISLLVGGIGIMNIMLVSVTERTKEIGIRKAIGATREEILTQFLLESIIVSLTGGIIGIGLGIFFGIGIGKFLPKVLPGSEGLIPVFSLNSTIAAFVFAFLVGITFGMYPANKASRLDPVDALRYE